MKPGMTRVLFAAIFMSLMILASGTAWGAMGEITAFSFRSAQEDVLGLERSLEPDGEPDVHFVLSLKGIGAVTDVSIKAVDGTREWDTARGSSNWALVIKDATGKTLTATSGMPIAPFLGFATLNLYLSDDGAAFSQTREYEVSVRFIDGSTATARTEVKGMPDIFKLPGPAQEEGSDLITATAYGIQGRDVAGKRETLGKDGANDAHFRVRFTTISVVDQITIRNVDGMNAMWDTIPGNGVWAIAVFMDGNLKNRADGSVRFPVDGDTTLDLWVADNGAVSGGKTRFEVIVQFNDGTIFHAIAAPGEEEPEAGEGILSAKLFPPETTDVANRGESPGADGNPDWRVDMSLSGQGTVISFIVRGVEGSVAEWDTLPGNKKPIIVVTDKAGKVLNSSSGTVSIAISEKKDLTLWLDDAGALADQGNRFRVIAVMSDGRTFERIIDRVVFVPGVPPKPVMPSGAVENIQESSSVRAFYMGKGPRNLVGKGEPADIRTGLDANPDAHIRLRLVSLQGTINSLTVESLDGKSGSWDTIPGNQSWHIAVTETATSPMLNKPDGSFSRNVSGNSELHLWLADNGKLSADPSNYRIIVRFTDGRALSQTIF